MPSLSSKTTLLQILALRLFMECNMLAELLPAKGLRLAEQETNNQVETTEEIIAITEEENNKAKVEWEDKCLGRME